MKPRITVVTLAVDDLERAVDFYRNGLGLKTKGIEGQEYEHGAVAFFEMENGLRLALWKRDDLAWDAKLGDKKKSGTELALGHNVATREEVDVVLDQAQNAGARITKPAAETFWGGYAGYFQDPDGHLWEVAYNPTFNA